MKVISLEGSTCDRETEMLIHCTDQIVLEHI